MRTIKFRAWHKREAFMFKCYSFNFFASIVQYHHRWIEFDDIELMQYTGLKDKNGKEIYESDIVTFIGYSGRVISWTPDEYHYAGWYAVEKGKRPIPLFSGDEPNTIEVIGNIYEHPDLLKT